MDEYPAAKMNLLENQKETCTEFLVELSFFFPVEIYEQVRSLVHAYAVETSLLQLGFETLPNSDGDVLSGGDTGGEFHDFFIQEAMVHGIENFAMHYLFQLLEVDDEARLRVDFPFHRNFERVVVAVAVGIVALAKKAKVFFRREVRIVIVVRCGEFRFTSKVDHIPI